MDAAWLSQDCFYVDKRERVARVIGHLRGDNPRQPIIEDHGRPYALVDPRALMRRGLHHDMALEKVAWPVPTIDNGDNVETAGQRFATSGAPRLPAILGRPPRKAGFLDANTIIQNLDDGPRANESGQGVPLLWNDATFEDAIQSFAASALPYLPVEGKRGLTGIIRRETLFPYIEHDADGMGRRDKAGDRDGFRQDTINALIEPGPPALRQNADFATVQTHLQDWPCLFIEHGYIEAITPTTVLQARNNGAEPEAPRQHFRQAKAVRQH